ncbi:glycoside hydrolase family 32 protein [Acutalibacter sp. 1XD8-33]|uniref:glycoside hydrolase family 32 protein n=1 Tax=Acutalibacter sp. 1XD8-33 TaxID=2320081 RepID=UPI0011C3C8E6|nr:glycoside hydrolase family 32 protein [Acutalibacter sp. 1XD8-33]
MRTRMISASGKYLLLPIAGQLRMFPPSGKLQILGLYRDEQLLEELELNLSVSPRAWGVLYLEPYAGQELELRLEGGDESLLDLLEVADEPKDADTLYREPERPLAHITPARGFMNDPNGLFYYKGEYHYFAQLNPYGFVPGNTHWMHMVSRDLAHWRELPYALLPDETGRMYSGGGIVDENNTSGLGKDGEPPIFLFYTAAGSKTHWSKGRPFEIAAAVSTDGGRTFEKLPENPLVPNILFMNRDPKVVWEPEGENWVMSIFLDNDRYMFLYSKDLIHWDQGDVWEIRGAAECPDLFCLPLDGDETKKKWVLWGSTDCYLVGHFAGRRFVPEGPAVEGCTKKLHSAYSVSAWSPGGYAAQTFTGLPGGRVVQVSWIRTWTSRGPFSSCASVPSELRLVSTAEGPRVFFWPVEEVENLYQDGFSFENRGLEEFERIPRQALGEAMDMTFRLTVKPDQPIAFSVRGVLIVYDPRLGRLMLPSGAYDVGPVGDTLELRIITDRMSMEFFVNGGQFQISLATVLDPAQTGITPVYLEPGIGVDFEVHRLGGIWET